MNVESDNNETIDWDHRHNIASNYLGFAGALAGLSFTAYYFYISLADFTNMFVIFTSLLLLITALLFLLGTIGYADAVKIHKDMITYRKIGDKDFSTRHVSWEKTIHLADMMTLIGFILMLAALSLGIMVYDTVIGVITAIMIWTLFFLFMVKSGSHG